MLINAIVRLNDWIASALIAIAAALTFFLGCIVVVDVGGRALFSTPFRGTPEIVSISIVIICFLAAAYTVRSGSMLRVTLLTDVLGHKGRQMCFMLASLLGMAFFLLIVWGGIDPMMHAWNSGQFEGEGARRIPVWPAKGAVVFGSALVALNYFGQFVMSVKRFAQGEADPAP